MSQTLSSLSRLIEILEAEFKLLQTDSLDVFESLQQKKQEIVESLETLLSDEEADSPSIDAVHESDISDPEVSELLERCRDYHVRNSMLLEKKIEVNKNALNILRSSRHSEEVETYDKLGKLRNPRTIGLKSDV